MRQLHLHLLLAAAGLAGLAAVPAHAQSQDRVLDIYGDDRCPASNGQEIVVCRKHPESERFRIPKDLRDVQPEVQAAGGNGNAVNAVNTTGGSGVQVGSCNAIGAGVSVGCVKSELDAWKAEQRAQKKADAAVP